MPQKSKFFCKNFAGEGNIFACYFKKCKATVSDDLRINGSCIWRGPTLGSALKLTPIRTRCCGASTNTRLYTSSQLESELCFLLKSWPLAELPEIKYNITADITSPPSSRLAITFCV